MTTPPPIDSKVTMEPRSGWTIATSAALTGSLVLTLTTSGGGIVVPLGGLETRGIEVLEPILGGLGGRGIELFLSGFGCRAGREVLNRGPLIGGRSDTLSLCFVLLVE